MPTLVEIEHVQLMDAASVALLDALASDLESSAWVIVVTRRDVAGGLKLDGHDHLRIELGALSREDTMALAQATSEAAQLPPHVLNLAVDRSGGSPEFLLDLLAAAAGGHPDELPDSVGAATMARIDALDPRDGVIVRRAAVLGLTFHPRRLRTCSTATRLRSTRGSGSGCRPCSSASPTVRSGSGVRPCKRRRTRAFRSS